MEKGYACSSLRRFLAPADPILCHVLFRSTRTVAPNGSVLSAQLLRLGSFNPQSRQPVSSNRTIVVELCVQIIYKRDIVSSLFPLLFPSYCGIAAPSKGRSKRRVDLRGGAIFFQMFGTRVSFGQQVALLDGHARLAVKKHVIIL